MYMVAQTSFPEHLPFFMIGSPNVPNIIILLKILGIWSFLIVVYDLLEPFEAGNFHITFRVN